MLPNAMSNTNAAIHRPIRVPSIESRPSHYTTQDLSDAPHAGGSVDGPVARSYNTLMALVFTFPCGGCGRTYSVYYPKSLLYELSGSAPRELGRQEDEDDLRSGAVEADRKST